MPFKSEKQRKWMHANKPKMAKKWEKEEVIKNFREIVRMELEGSCGYGIDGKVGDEPAGPHLLKKKKKEEESVDEERDYKAEYKKYGSSTKAKKYRAELNKYNRQKGTYGNGDGKDASHKGGKIVGFEAESKNRGRAEKSRLKKESSSAYGKSIEKIANDRKLKSLSKKDRDTLMKIAKLMKKSNESVNEAKSFKPEKRRKLKSGEVEVMKGRGSKQRWFYLKDKNDVHKLIRLGRNYGFPTGITNNNSRIDKSFIKRLSINESVNEAIEPQGNIKKVLDVNKTKTAKKIGGTLVDITTANMMSQVWDKVNDKSKEKMNKMNTRQLTNLILKLWNALGTPRV